MTAGAGGLTLRAGCVALAGRGLLILGTSGSGKSGLALQLMALGCDLVSDDYTEITPADGGLLARAPAAIAGRIEARGVGILAATAVTARIVLAVDLDTEETDRLPPWRNTVIAGVDVTLLHRVANAHFPASIVQYLKAGRSV